MGGCKGEGGGGCKGEGECKGEGGVDVRESCKVKG